MQREFDAVYEHGTFRPLSCESLGLAEGQRVRLTVDDRSLPVCLRLAMSVYEGLSDAEIEDIERIALARGSFFKVGSDT